MNLQDHATARSYGKWCGKYTAKGRAFDGSEVVYNRVNCKCWNCAFCAPRRAKAYASGIAKAAQFYGLTRFVTLTLDPKLLGNEIDSCKYLRECFNKLRVYLGRKFGKRFKYIAVLEFHKSGVAHLHMVVNSYIEWAWLKQTWLAVGGGSHVHIERHKDAHRISQYLAKDLCGRVAQYLVKDLSSDVPKKQRRVTCSRGIQLLEKLAKHHRWTLIRESITWVFQKRAAVARDVEIDRNEKLVRFVVPTAVGSSLQLDSPGYGGWEVSFA